MVKLTYHDLGGSVAFKIKGNSKEEVEQAHWLYYNHNVTSGEIIWIDEVTHTECYFLSDFKRMLKGLESIWFHRLCNDPVYKKHKCGVIQDAKDRAFKELRSLEEEHFYRCSVEVDEDFYEFAENF